MIFNTKHSWASWVTLISFFGHLLPILALESASALAPDSKGLCSPSRIKLDEFSTSICSHMSPRKGYFESQPTTTSPWKIYTWKPEIQQYFAHPVVLGSDDGKLIFLNYMLAATSVDDGYIVGHFEYQWDATSFCCYVEGRNYSYEGHGLHPNFLVGTISQRVQTANQTVLWTAPKYFEGSIVFRATFWTSSHQYWANVTSQPVKVIKRIKNGRPIAGPLPLSHLYFTGAPA